MVREAAAGGTANAPRSEARGRPGGPRTARPRTRARSSGGWAFRAAPDPPDPRRGARAEALGAAIVTGAS